MNSISAVTRPAAVAGMFYPASPEALRTRVREFLDEGRADEAAPPKVLIVPHAAYIYSGSTAARGYATLRQIAGRLGRTLPNRPLTPDLPSPAASRFSSAPQLTITRATKMLATVRTCHFTDESSRAQRCTNLPEPEKKRPCSPCRNAVHNPGIGPEMLGCRAR